MKNKDVYKFMCAAENCEYHDKEELICDIAQATKHFIETGHEVYQFVVINGRAVLTAMINAESVGEIND